MPFRGPYKALYRAPYRQKEVSDGPKKLIQGQQGRPGDARPGQKRPELPQNCLCTARKMAPFKGPYKALIRPFKGPYKAL